MERHRLSSTELIATAGGLLLIISLFLPWYGTDSSNRVANIDGGTRDLLLLGRAPDPALAAAAGRARPVHPRLHHRPRAPAVLGARRADGRRRHRRARPPALQRLRRPPRATRTAPSTSSGAGSSPCSASCSCSSGRPSGRRRPSASASPRGSSEPMAANRPDRNLALELVRVTEAAALAAARLVGMGDKEAADQAAVDAMRLVLDTRAHGRRRRHRRGREGRGADALQRRAHRRRLAAGGRHRGRPARGHDADGQGHAERAVRHRAQPARGRCSTPGPASTWRSSPAARTSPTCSTSTGRCRDLLRDVAERRDVDVGDIMVVVLDRPRHEEGIAAIRDAGARVRLISDGDVSAALLAVSDRSPVDAAVGHRRHARGRHLGRGDQVDRRRPRRPAVAARRRRAQGRARRGLRPRPPAARRTTSSAGDDCFFSATGVTDGDVLQGVRYRGGATATTESLVMRSRTGTVRRVTRDHNRAKLRALRRRALRLRPPAPRTARPTAPPGRGRPPARSEGDGPCGSGTSSWLGEAADARLGEVELGERSAGSRT